MKKVLRWTQNILENAAGVISVDYMWGTPSEVLLPDPFRSKKRCKTSKSILFISTILA